MDGWFGIVFGALSCVYASSLSTFLLFPGMIVLLALIDLCAELRHSWTRQHFFTLHLFVIAWIYAMFAVTEWVGGKNEFLMIWGSYGLFLSYLFVHVRYRRPSL